MILSKISIPLTLAASIAVSGAGAAVTVGSLMGSSKEETMQLKADVAQLKDHDRDSYGAIQRLEAAMDRVERHLGTK